MTDRNKFEEMLERLVNEDREGAEELFHEIVVEKSREIYENLLEDEEVEETTDEEVDEATDEEVDEATEDDLDESTDEEVEVDYTALSRAKLMALCKERGIPVKNTSKKADLVALLTA